MMKFKYLAPVVAAVTLLFSFSCFAQTPGTQKWVFSSTWDVTSSPAIGPGGVIYVGSFNFFLHAINPDGTLKWEFHTSGKVRSSPAIGPDGVIYVGSDDAHLYAIHPDGTEKWKFHTSYNVSSSPAIGPDGVIYFGSEDKNLYALNPDGTQKWEFDLHGRGPSSPAIGPDGVIYVGSWDYNLYAVNPDGTQKWAFASEYPVSSSPAIGADGVIYVGSGDQNLYAVYPDGRRKWAYNTGAYIQSSPAIDADGVIYIGGGDGVLHAIHPNGTRKWAFSTRGQISSSPAIGADGVIFVGSGDGSLYAVNPDGTQRWAYAAGEDVRSSPAIGVDGVIYFGSDDNNIHAVYSESPGLAQAPWPRFCRDFHNSGSSQSLLTIDDDDSITFDFFTAGAAVGRTFELYNPNPLDITVTGCTFSNSSFSLETTPPIVIKGGRSASLTAAVSPHDTGLYPTDWRIDYEVDEESGSASKAISMGLFRDGNTELAYTARRALDAYTLCEAEDADSAATKNNLGVLYRLLGEADLAEEYLQDALGDGLNNLNGYAGIKMNMGVVKSDQGDSNYAKGYYSLAYTDISDNQGDSAIAPQIFYNNAREGYDAEDYATALAHVNNTINHAMTNTFLMAKAHILRGAISHARGDAGAGEADFRQALALDPDGAMGAMARSNLTPAGCTSVNADLALDTRVDLGGVKYQFTLKHAAVAADPSGLYWKLDMATLQALPASAEGCAQLGEGYSLPVCAEYYGNVFNFTLDFAQNPDDPGGLYWKAANREPG
ncbi:MAG: PQQ-binding-like beta-propeller repeat protein [Desulfobacterales bacterium]|nr:PQQ-binding-like beta-propeller repeat protein [Desulfobacterales bacterium]